MTETTTEIDYVARRQEMYDWLVDHPERHDQTFFVKTSHLRGPDYEADFYQKYWSRTVVEGSCGSSLCISGLACLRYGPLAAEYRNGDMRLPDGTSLEMDAEAAKYLGLSVETDDDGECIADCIFYCFDNERALARLKMTIDNPAVTLEELQEI